MNTVTEQHLDKLLDDAQREEYIYFGKVLVVEYLLPNGFSIQGRAACVDPANFDLAMGQRIARKDAINKLWQLEGYLLQQKLHDNGVL